MSKPKIFKDDFHSILRENPSIFSWITKEVNIGFYYSNLSNLHNFIVTESIWSQLDYEVPSEEDKADLWRHSVGISGRTKIDKLKEYIASGEKLPEPVEKCEFTFLTRNGEFLNCEPAHLIIEDSNNIKHLFIKFIKLDDQDSTNSKISKRLKSLQKLKEIYEETNELANVGGWEVDLIKNDISWTKVTKAIHCVSEDYIPNLETGINFFKEGWSRDLLIKRFTNCVENGVSYDDEFIIVLADGSEKWVRSLGKAEMWEGRCIRVYGAFQDINDRKLQEESHKKAELRFQNIYENSSLGIILVNQKNNLEMANPVARTIFGLENLPEKEVLTYTFKDVIKPEYLPLAIEKRKELLAGSISNYNIDVECYHHDGRSIWCSLKSSLVKSEAKDDHFIITQVEDITNKKRLERKSLENATRFKRVFEYSPNGMALVDLRGKWRNVNNNLAQMLGYTKEEIVKQTLEQLTHPDDRSNDINLFTRIINKELDTYQVEKRYIHKSGSIVNCYLTVSGLRNDQGEVSSLIGHVVDMTEQIRAKIALEDSLADLKALLDSTTQVIIIETDLNRNIRKFNKGAENLLGYKAEEVIGKQKSEIFHLKDEIEQYRSKLQTKYGESVNTNETFSFKLKKNHLESNEWTYVKKDGSKFPVQLVITAIRNEEGEVRGYLGVATDITSLKVMENSLLKAKNRAETANRSKSEFLANMSHEIRTPLNGVIGFTDLLMKTSLDENQSRYMETVYSCAITLLDLINDILDFSKIEAGKLEINEEPTNLTELCGRSVEMIKQQAHQKDIEVLLNISSKLDKYVLADGLRLRQIIINLLSNAVKFTQAGEIELKIEQREFDESKQKTNYEFFIRDTGIGIAPQNLQKIFKAFNQEDASTTRKYGGTGLGLTISNRLLELMGSKLSVKSTLGVGTTFSFTVALSNENTLPTDGSTISSVKRILVVDDNENNRVILNEMLLDRNIESRMVQNGIEALDILENDTDFDLAIIDYHMPYLNGIELIRHIRNELNIGKEKLPILLLHSSGEDQVLNEQSAGLDILSKIVKPVQRHQLFEFFDDFEKSELSSDVNLEVVEELDLTNISPTILIAEDNPVNKFLTRTIVKKVLPNSILIEVDNGAEAVDAYKDNSIDFILMDIQMPIMSGFEATKAIRKIESSDKRIIIIALTARAIKGERDRCLANGMDDYVSKPVVLEDLKQCILKFLTKRSFEII